MTTLRKHTVTLSYENSSEYIFSPNAKVIQKYIVFILDLLCSGPTEVSIRFCGTKEMTQTNHQFRQKNKPTDVLSFSPAQFLQHNPNFLGDILICVPICIKQAKRAKHPLSAELLKMLTHALVHLKGLDHDRNDGAARVMSKLERALKTELLKQFGQPHFEKEKI